MGRGEEVTLFILWSLDNQRSLQGCWITSSVKYASAGAMPEAKLPHLYYRNKGFLIVM